MVQCCVLAHKQAEVLYDRFGAKQDTQGFYEDIALDDLVAHADFAGSSGVLELGCGTGRFAEQLLSGLLPAEATYLGLDVSTTMVALATKRLERFGARAAIQKTDGSMLLPVGAGSVDCVVSTYAADLLSEPDIELFVAEAHRVLRGSGRLCVVGLTRGDDLVTGIVSLLWTIFHRFWPERVGGCRPLSFESHLDERWRRLHHTIVSRWGIPSEVLVAEKL